MASLHGILAELGIENPIMHPERDVTHEWIVDAEFTPVIGSTYELAFGRIPFGGEERQLIKHVRIDGADDWFDLEDHRPLDPKLRAFPVKAFRLLA